MENGMKFPQKIKVEISRLHAKSLQLFETPQTAAHQASPVLHYLSELAQIHVHRVCDAVQTSRPWLSPSPPTLSLSLHKSLF